MTYPDDGLAEVRRLRLMARPLPRKRRRAHRHPRNRPWLALLLLMAIVVIPVIAITMADPAEPGDSGDRPAPEPTVESRESRGPQPRPVPEDPLITAARQVKPLEDSEKGDRVLYRGQVCAWLEFAGDIDGSTIKCPGQKSQLIQTGRLTPIERKDPQ